MSVTYQTLKAMSEEDLVDRYNTQAGWTAESLDLFAEELRHRELCGLLQAMRADLAARAEAEMRMIDALCFCLLELLESRSPGAEKRAKALYDRAARFLESGSYPMTTPVRPLPRDSDT